jgi:hypothetical protein
MYMQGQVLVQVSMQSYCSPCGASINLYETKYSDSEANLFHLGDSHNFTGRYPF